MRIRIKIGCDAHPEEAHDREIEADVFGDWAVHEVALGRGSVIRAGAFMVSHIPTGRGTLEATGDLSKTNATWLARELAGLGAIKTQDEARAKRSAILHLIDEASNNYRHKEATAP
jgi:hypothetical protein